MLHCSSGSALRATGITPKTFQNSGRGTVERLVNLSIQRRQQFAAFHTAFQEVIRRYLGRRTVLNRSTGVIECTVFLQRDMVGQRESWEKHSSVNALLPLRVHGNRLYTSSRAWKPCHYVEPGGQVWLSRYVNKGCWRPPVTSRKLSVSLGNLPFNHSALPL